MSWLWITITLLLLSSGGWVGIGGAGTDDRARTSPSDLVPVTHVTVEVSPSVTTFVILGVGP